MNGAIAAFLADVRGIPAQADPSEQGIGRLVERMRALVHDPDVLATHEAFTQTVATGEAAAELFADTGRRSELLYTDESGLTLVRSRFDPDEPTPIHSHGSWGIVGVYAGRDQHESWRRVDDGAEAGHAVVELIEERVLEPGDVVIIPHPPQDIQPPAGLRRRTGLRVRPLRRECDGCPTPALRP
jgi:hypothetical protein